MDDINNERVEEFFGWVFIKYDDNREEQVMTSSIENFHPKSADDYIYGQYYVVRSAKWDNCGKIQRYNGYICRMNETLSGLVESVQKKRVKHPPLADKDENYLSSLSEHERKNSVGNYTVPGHTESLKRKAAAKDAEAFLNAAFCSKEGSNATGDVSLQQKVQSFKKVKSAVGKVTLGTQSSGSKSSPVTPTEKTQPSPSNLHQLSVPKTSTNKNTDFDQAKKMPTPQQKLQPQKKGSSLPSNGKHGQGILKPKELFNRPDSFRSTEKPAHNNLDRTGPFDASPSSAATADSVITINSALQRSTVAALEEKIKTLEEEKRLMEKNLSAKTTIETKLASIVDKLNEVPTLEMFQKLIDRLESVERSLKSMSTTSTSDLKYVQDWLNKSSF